MFPRALITATVCLAALVPAGGAWAFGEDPATGGLTMPELPLLELTGGLAAADDTATPVVVTAPGTTPALSSEALPAEDTGGAGPQKRVKRRPAPVHPRARIALPRSVPPVLHRALATYTVSHQLVPLVALTPAQ